ncbi:MAG: hypothetical protein N3F03_08250 [Ignavibacteria bacterium]|nr:hypothetical protein [Ignavibacteria bacterium]
MKYKNLVIVAGHAVYIGKNFNNVFDDANWFLYPFQKGEPKLYIEHIKVGCEIARSDENSFLIFTGGQSRKEAYFRSEAQMYWEIANHLGYLDEDLKSRTTTEEFSRDSFENLLFPICRFREYLGYYPEHITMVTFKFKEVRFHLHRKALRIPESMVTFVGPNNPDDVELARKGEAKAIELMKNDPYCCNDELLEKKNQRNPWKRQHGYTISCPELKELLEYRGRKIFNGKLPWD